jgi:hypothetical protein
MATVQQYKATPAVEFKNGLTRASMGNKYGGPAGATGLLGRLNTSSTLYRQSAPTHGNLNGSPGIPESGLKDYNRVGVDFFGSAGRGAGNGSNAFTNQARSAAGNNNNIAGSVGKPNNRGFMCGKILNYSIDNSDFGSGNPATAADASFYRQNMNVDRYGDQVAFTDSRGNDNTFNARNGGYDGGQNAGSEQGGKSRA